MVRWVISQLPEQQRVFTLFKIEGKTYQQISQQQGIFHSTIDKHIYSANKYVTKQLTSAPISLYLSSQR